MNDDMEVLPCGCRMYSVNGNFVFEPHSLNCEFYLYVLGEAERIGKPTTFLEM